MTVREMLARMTSLELAEWQAYENKVGPLGTAWHDEQIAEINEILQSMLHMYISLNTKGNSDDSKPRTIIRPWDLFQDWKRRVARGETK